MTSIADAPVPLEALSEGQRRLVERHLPLVNLTLRRHAGLIRDDQVGREHAELFQEGAIALAEAIKHHDPARHGDFPAFAMARIHFAISRFAHEHSGVIRVPFIAQRRQRDQQKASTAAQPAVEALPRVTRSEHGMTSLPSRSTFYSDEAARPDAIDRPTLGDLIRDRIDAAGRRAIAEMKSSPRMRRDSSGIIEECHAERWSIPDPESRTPIRQLCRSLGCSMGRITHSEERYRKLVVAALEEDEDYERLRELVRRHPAGYRHRPLDHEGRSSESAKRRKLDPR